WARSDPADYENSIPPPAPGKPGRRRTRAAAAKTRLPPFVTTSKEKVHVGSIAPDRAAGPAAARARRDRRGGRGDHVPRAGAVGPSARRTRQLRRSRRQGHAGGGERFHGRQAHGGGRFVAPIDAR